MGGLFGGGGPSAGEMEAMRVKEEERLRARQEEEEAHERAKMSKSKEFQAERDAAAKKLRDSLLGRLDEEDEEPVL